MKNKYLQGPHKQSGEKPVSSGTSSDRHTGQGGFQPPTPASGTGQGSGPKITPR